MTSTTVIHQGPSPEEDYGLDAIAQHNAAVASTEQFPVYQDDAKGLGIYHDGYTPATYADSPSYLHNPPTPRSNTTSDGIRTRSGRSTRGRTDSPFDNGRISKSPAARSKKDKKSSKLDKSKTPKLTAPLSILTKDMSVPKKDMDAWVNRSAADRQAEVEKRNGYVTRPMNSFMLYRSCYAERTKAWCVQNNHQVVSSVSGESWPMEPQEVRQQFEEWARLERANHAKAHPEYKFSPSKSTKRRKGEFSDDEGDDGVSQLDDDPDGEYRAGGGGRNTRQRRAAQAQQQQQQEMVPLNSTFGFDSHPYYAGQQGLSGYEQSQYQYANPGRPLPSNVAYDTNGIMYDPRTGTYIQQATYQHPQYPYIQDVRGVRVPTPAQQQQQQSVGGYGLPGGQQMGADELFATTTSRSGTPAQSMQQYVGGYGQPVYPQYTASHQQSYSQPTPPNYSQPPSQPSVQQAYAEHQAYLQAAAQPQTAIDPSLEAEFGKDMGAVDHFGDALGDMSGGDLSGLEYYQPETTSPVDGNGVSAWSSGEVLQ